ncbi:ATP-grasp ribosomal peptide maturase [Actinopolyspora saharensis]|uniref:ATP-grasp ribosomal peptide maturase n=1 Tax=Actinopolyspora saharensis TaxID=995062 RepID=UPI003F67C732
MPAPSVVVVTREQDITADLVVRELHERGVGVARFDLSDFPERMRQAAYLVPGRDRWTGALRGTHRDVDLSAVRGVWYRKPAPTSPHPSLTATERNWVAAEARTGLGGLLAALPARWINRPDAAALASQKPAQLRTAVACGLDVPESLLTNDPERAREFCAGGPVIYKPLGGGPSSENGHRVALRTTTVTAEEITDGVGRTTHLFQRRVECAYAVRCTVVGDLVFAARLELPAGVDTVDWRDCHDELTITPIEVPSAVGAGLRALMTRLGLVFAAPDFVVDPDGRWYFIGDLNPNGQWAWIEHLREPITRALADELTASETA